MGAGYTVSTTKKRASAFKIGKSAKDISTILSQSVKDGAIALVTGCEQTKEDIVLPVVALDSHRTLFSFGKNFGQLTLTVTVYLGCPSCGNSDILQKLSKGFDAICVSKFKKPIDVSIAGDKAYPCYVLKYTMGQINATNNSVQVSLQCITAPPKD